MSGSAPWLQTHWDWRAAGNFIGGGSGGGLLLALALASLLQAPVFGGALLALLLIGGGLGLVWLELGRPWRSLHVFFHPQTSWMTREAAVSVPLILCAAGAWFLESSLLLWLAAALGGGFVYCQGRILLAARGIPAWRHPRILALIMTTGLAEGMGLLGMLLVVSAAPGGVNRSTAWLLLLLIVLAARALAWNAYRQGLRGQAPDAALAALDAYHRSFLWFGHVLPALLAGLALGSGGTLADVISLTAGLASVGAGWKLKFVIVRRAAYNQGYAIMQTAARGGGRSGPGSKPGWS